MKKILHRALQDKLLLGVVHLQPLPGSPSYQGDRDEIRQAARRDAEVLLQGGMDGFCVENFGDTPYHKDDVEDAVVAEMTLVTHDLVGLAGRDKFVGVNVLRNDASAALAVASAAGAHFIRVNVHHGVMYSDQGLIEGQAARTLRERRQLGADVVVLADVAVKHATPPAGFDLVTSARDTVHRGGATGLIVTGKATGSAVDFEELRRVRDAVPSAPILVGSGVTADTVQEALSLANGVIVGTWTKRDGRVRNPVDVERVRALVSAAREKSQRSEA